MSAVQVVAIGLAAIVVMVLAAVGMGTYLRAHEPPAPDQDQED